jgi:hypothetical protein
MTHKLTRSTRILVDTAPLIASHERTGRLRAGEVMDSIVDGNGNHRVYFAPDGGTPLWISAHWIAGLDAPKMAGWMRYRFHCNAADPRPVRWPAAGPYWVTGYSADDSHATVVAYLPPGEHLLAWWPDAIHTEVEHKHSIAYTDRMPRPAWWGGE